MTEFHSQPAQSTAPTGSPSAVRIVATYAMDDPAASAWLRAYLHTLARVAVGALEKAGADVTVVNAASDSADAEALLRQADGVLILGGGDMDPSFYGQERAAAELYGINAQADAFELELARDAVATGVPLLGICRGMQVLNVAAGGTLIQDLAAGIHTAVGDNSDMTDHEVMFFPGSALARIYGSVYGEAGANGTEVLATIRSGHHQAIDRLGEGLAVVARAPDQVIEAVEGTGDGWVMGVQWHPEDPDSDPVALAALVGAFVAECAAKPDTELIQSRDKNMDGSDRFNPATVAKDEPLETILGMP